MVTAEICLDQGHEEPESESDIPYFDGRVVLEGTPIEPKKRYASGWLRIGSGKHGCRGLKFEVAREKGWCAKDPCNPTVMPKGPSLDWKPEDDLPYREKLRRGIVDQ